MLLFPWMRIRMSTAIPITTKIPKVINYWTIRLFLPPVTVLLLFPPLQPPLPVLLPGLLLRKPNVSTTTTKAKNNIIA